MSTFDITLKTSASLHPGGEPDRFVGTHVGVIRRTCDRDGRTFVVGLAKARRIHADLAAQAGESLFDACDCHSQELPEVQATLFDPRTDDLRDDVRDRFDVIDTDVLVLEYVLLSPRWRGLKVGLMAARRMIDLLGGGCGLVVSWTFPLNPDASEFAKVPAGWIPRYRGGDEWKEARRRLRRHFRRLGFQRLGKTRFDILSLLHAAPTLEDIVRPGR